MNYFRLKTAKNAAGEPVGPHHAHIQLSAACDADNNFGGVLRTHFEVAVLQGRRLPLPDGGTEYWLQLDDTDARILAQALTLAFYSPQSN